MAATASNGMVAGMYYMWIATRSDAGYPMGSLRTPNSPVVATTYAAYRLKHPVSYTPPEITRAIATRKGGQGLRGNQPLGIESFGNAQIVVDAYDETFHALISGSLVDVSTITNWAATSINANQGSLPHFIVGLSMGFTGDNGQEFLTVVFHNCTIIPKFPGASQEAGVNPNAITYEIVVDSSTRTGFARLFSASGLSVVDNSDLMTIYRYTYPIYVTTFIKDAIATTFTVPFLPTSSDATGAATNSITNNGGTLVVTSISVTTGLVTLAAAGTSGHIVVAATPTQYVAS